MRGVLFLISLIAWPGLYFLLLDEMSEKQVPRPPRVPFFFLFGTTGGWLIALALSPSGLTAMCIIPLVTMAPLSLLVSSIWLALRPERTVFHRVAMWCGF